MRLPSKRISAKLSSEAVRFRSRRPEAGQKVTFSGGDIRPPSRPQGPLSARTAYLRRIHQRLLGDEAWVGDEPVAPDPAQDGAPGGGRFGPSCSLPAPPIRSRRRGCIKHDVLGTVPVGSAVLLVLVGGCWSRTRSFSSFFV